MTVWLVRAGRHGEFEERFIREKRIYVTWDRLNVNLGRLPDREALRDVLVERYPDAQPNTISNWVSQIWPFASDMKKGDMIVLPLKSQPSIQVGEIVGDYHFDKDGTNPFFSSREVKWIGDAVPRANFGQDLLYSFGAYMTICRVQRNNAEARLKAMRAKGWSPESVLGTTRADPDSDEDSEGSDLEQLGRDQIAQLIGARFKGHGLTRLVEAVLKAQGYTTYRSPQGADGGADILAGAGPLGFGTPRLCVEVKSEASPIDRPTVDKLLGAVTKFSAQEGLFVSWSGFKPTVQKDLASSFFRVRLWTQNDLLNALFAHYDQLDEEIKAELPLKRIWTVAASDETT